LRGSSDADRIGSAETEISFAEKLIHSHVEHCIEEAQNPAEGKRKLSELLSVLERYVE
jgi:DNA-binding FrmR family transcriptional regulator